MAQLTAQDVVEKRFQSVKFREGYDQIEVDEFLDEVVATIHALTVENAELKAQLDDCGQRVAELSQGAMPVEVVEEVVTEPEPEPEPEPQPAVAAGGDTASSQAAGMLSLAQKLHDEYVDDGRAAADKLIAEAQEEGAGIVRAAEEERARVMDALSMEKADLEKSINNLRAFESDYRTSISDHLESLLKEVKASPEPA